jgi:ribose transport system substrate-binding protein
MTAFERRRKILDHLDIEKVTSVDALSAILNVSPSTIRSDLIHLEEQGLIRRVYGGALRKESAKQRRFLFFKDEDRNIEKKRRIAQRAANLVEDGDAIVLGAGTTALEMVDYLLERRQLTVFTNGLEVAMSLAENPTHKVYLTGGLLRSDNASLTSNFGGHNLEGVQVRKAFLSCNAFSLERGPMCDDLLEVELNQAMVNAAEQIFILCDSSKFDQSSLAPFATFSEIRQIITDSDVTEPVLDALRETGITVTVCGRKVVTLSARGNPARRYRIGFANLTEDDSYSVAVREGLERAADEIGNIELLLADNRLDGEVAIANAENFIEKSVDLVIEFQSHEKAGNIIMDLFRRSTVPVIAMHIPMPGATYFGVDNYRAGRLGGEAAGLYAVKHWNGKVDRVISLDLPQSGPVPAARMQGQLEGIRELVKIPDECILHFDSKNTFDEAYLRVRELLPHLGELHHNIIIAINDPTVLGAIEAIRKARRESDFIFVGQNADALGRKELRRPGTRLLGSVAYFPERQGKCVLQTALEILEGKQVPPAVYIDHAWITPENIDEYYPVEGEMGKVAVIQDLA